ncbi:hypothetical protein IW261DRAFT_1572231 [Armillaria novae-zelandiae]|uniref:Uncharacterized protein n=1 Tax=Armillaria novae-zelandiae TaxID=153914 RepID=A0AA39T880_9AGAR|nr:hypothetical protein IW261DRAFT_1572231 [Armillaria novae-zelandiae]
MEPESEAAHSSVIRIRTPSSGRQLGPCMKSESINTDLRPVTLSGDIIALNDNDISQTVTPNTTTAFKLSSPLATILVSPRPALSLSTTLLSPASPHTHLAGSMALEPNSLELYSLSSFPPTLTSKVSSLTQELFDAPTVILGERATAMYVYVHMIAQMVSQWEEHDGYEKLITAVFPRSAEP